MQEMTFDLLTEIRDKLVHLETKVEQLTTDVNLVHKFQKSFTERLSIVENFCIGQPLRSTPVPREDGRDGNER